MAQLKVRTHDDMSHMMNVGEDYKIPVITPGEFVSFTSADGSVLALHSGTIRWVLFQRGSDN